MTMHDSDKADFLLRLFVVVVIAWSAASLPDVVRGTWEYLREWARTWFRQPPRGPGGVQ